MSSRNYVPRLIDAYLADLLTAFPAVLLTGPRATGKTTTALRHADTVVRLDRYEDAGAFRAAPDATLAAQTGRVLLDEWQEVPEILGAVKRAVDAGAEPGRFLLTGSVRAVMTTRMWPGTGRVLHARMYPMTNGELHATGDVPATTAVDRMKAGRPEEIPLPTEAPNLLDYLELAVAGGYPEIACASARKRALWLESYLEQVFARDTASLGENPDPRRLRRFVHAVAANTAGIVADTELARVADVSVKTAKHYQQLLEDLGILDSVPAWFSNRISRLVKARKLYAIDSGLAAAALGVDVNALLRDTDLLGRMLDTFVAAQIRPLLGLREDGSRLHHLRHRDGHHEVDLVIEFRDGRILGMEVKASAGPSPADARHLGWLRDQLGDRFIAGVVLHTGKWTYPLGERISALPIAALWG